MIDPGTAKEVLDIAIPVLMTGSGIVGAGCVELYHSLRELGGSDTGTPHESEGEYEYDELYAEAMYPLLPDPNE